MLPERFDTDRQKQMANLAVITNRDQVDHIDLPGQDIAVLLSGDDTEGQMAVFEIVAEPGGGALPHYKSRENEYW